MYLQDPMRFYRSKRDNTRRRVGDKYTILGFISSGTYGRVYQARSKEEDGQIHAIKKFKPDKEGDVVTYTGISQSAIREIAASPSVSQHENVVALKEVLLEDKSIYMVFEYAEHDFLQVIHHHSQTLRSNISTSVLKSLTYQLLNGLLYLHQAHIIHRDLKPANILITHQGVVKIGDLGLARLTYEPLQPLFAGDKVVVTIWYRAPELLLGAKHYNRAVDIWAIGCVVAELASLRPIFKGEEAKLDAKKNVPFQKDQMLKIFEVLGTPSEHDWPGVKDMPEYHSMKRIEYYAPHLREWCTQSSRRNIINHQGYDFLNHLFRYDPDQRLSAKEAMLHKWFQEDPVPNANAFHGLPHNQIPPNRRITQDDAPSMMPMPAVAPATSLHSANTGMNALHPAQMSGKASAGSFGSAGGGHSRKKPRLGKRFLNFTF
ncbi:hypothetical protein QCA50_016529 [Cerrena zonata]|uniref:Cyclin-dependent kinase 8 n=1 Tax=Cerrena zonata TaxID=2478898 RepID=A0AAW0FPZ4_9APHY